MYSTSKTFVVDHPPKVSTHFKNYFDKKTAKKSQVFIDNFTDTIDRIPVVNRYSTSTSSKARRF